jgi:hypothetical protein
MRGSDGTGRATSLQVRVEREADLVAVEAQGRRASEQVQAGRESIDDGQVIAQARDGRIHERVGRRELVARPEEIAEHADSNGGRRLGQIIGIRP